MGSFRPRRRFGPRAAKAQEIPTLSVKDKDDSVVEVSYEWVLMGPKTVCRQTPQDPMLGWTDG